MQKSRLLPLTAIAVAALVTAACERSQRDSVSTTASSDTTTGYGSTTTPPGAAVVANRDIPAFSETRTPSLDADQDFLRMMVDHHEGIIQLTNTVTGLRESGLEAEAKALKDRQEAEQKKLIAMAKRVASDSVKPNLSTWGNGLSGALRGLAGAAYSKKFYEQVVAHHQEGIRIVDEMTPNLRNAEVKQVAKKMKADWTAEIARFQKKVAAAN